MASKGPLGIVSLDHVDFVVHDLERSVGFYQDKLDFGVVARSNARQEASTGERSIVFGAGKASVRCSTPRTKDSAAARFLRSHPDGIRTVAMRVRDAQAAYKAVVDRGGNPIEEPVRSGRCTWFDVASPLGDVEYRFIERPDTASSFDLDAVVGGTGGGNRHGFAHIDHITSNTRDLRSLTNWYRDVLGFEHYWDIRFHTKDSNPDAPGSGLESIVMWEPGSNIKFATNEPLRPSFYNSQIQKFVEDNGGPGVQHVALSSGTIMDTIPAMRDAGIKFLETPDAYYEMLPRRLAERAVENLKEDIESLRKRRILVDGRDNRYLLQIFMQDAALMYDEAAAGPFFYEVIQRHGEQGFGEGNFRALFESIERQQTGETSRTLEDPKLND